jgi:flagellin
MSLRINTNVAALNAYRNLATTTVQLGKSLEKLSSGFQINRAADDAAGLVKSETLRAEIRGNAAALRNSQDGVSFVQTAEGALSEVHSILQRIRELAVGASNTATTDGVAEQAEVAQLLLEISAIGANTTFAGKAVFSNYSGTNPALVFQVGSKAGQTLSITDDLVLSSADVFNTDISGINVDSAASAAITTVDTAIAAVSTTRGKLGATQNRLESVSKSLSVAVENLTASESRIRDTDMAMEMTGFTRSQILSQAGMAMLAQAQAVPQNVLTLLR